MAAGVALAVIASGLVWGLPTRCVQLPNGMNIGKQAVIDLGRPFFQPDIVPKFENGDSLLPGDAWPFYTTETTVYGTAMAADHKDDFHFVWRPDTGLVRQVAAPLRYKRLIAEAGPTLEGIPDGILGVEIVMWELQKQPAYADQTCWTRWVNW